MEALTPHHRQQQRQQQPQPQQPAMQNVGWPDFGMMEDVQPPVPPTSMPTPLYGPAAMMVTGRGASPSLQFMLPQQDARFHFSGDPAAFSGGAGFGPSTDDMLEAFMPGCDMDASGYNSGSSGGGSLGLLPHCGLAPSPYRPSPLSNGSTGNSAGITGRPSPGHTGSGGSGSSRLQHASGPYAAMQALGGMTPAVASAVPWTAAAAVEASAPAVALQPPHAQQQAAPHQHQPQPQPQPQLQAQPPPQAALQQIASQPWWMQQVGGSAPFAGSLPAASSQPGLLPPVQIPKATQAGQSAPLPSAAQQPQQQAQAPQQQAQPQAQTPQQAYAMMQQGMGGWPGGRWGTSGVTQMQMNPMQWQQQLVAQQAQWQQMMAMFAANQAHAAQQAQQAKKQQPAASDSGAAVPQQVQQQQQPAMPAADSQQALHMQMQMQQMQQMQAAWMQQQAGVGGFPGGMPGFPFAQGMPMAPSDPWHLFQLGQQFGQRLASQQQQTVGGQPSPQQATQQVAAQQQQQQQPPAQQPVPAEQLPVPQQPPQASQPATALQQQPSAGPVAGSIQSAGSHYMAQAAMPAGFPATGWPPGGAGSGPLCMLSDAGLAHIKWEYGCGAPDPGGPSEPDSAGRSDAGSGAMAVPDMNARSAARPASAGSGGAAAVPDMPASAKLANSLMPPPQPSGGVSVGARMTRAERVERYREKKARRTDGATVRYHARQANAHRRPRIKGRFVKAGELASHLADHPDESLGGVTAADLQVVNGVDASSEYGEAPTSTDDTAIALSAPSKVQQQAASRAPSAAASIDSPAAFTA